MRRVGEACGASRDCTPGSGGAMSLSKLEGAARYDIAGLWFPISRRPCVALMQRGPTVFGSRRVVRSELRVAETDAVAFPEHFGVDEPAG